MITQITYNGHRPIPMLTGVGRLGRGRLTIRLESPCECRSIQDRNVELVGTLGLHLGTRLPTVSAKPSDISFGLIHFIRPRQHDDDYIDGHRFTAPGLP